MQAPQDTKQQQRLWALIVTIEHYAETRRHRGASSNATARHPTVAGATIDGDGTFDYLTKDLGVAEKCIRRLHDKEATRAAIISEFQSHFIHNSKIQRGDAIYFHYSGHGGRIKAPDGWTVGQGTNPTQSSPSGGKASVPSDKALVDEILEVKMPGSWDGRWEAKTREVGTREVDNVVLRFKDSVHNAQELDGSFDSVGGQTSRWTVPDNTLEAIIPYDEGCLDDTHAALDNAQDSWHEREGGRRICCIPDRTIGMLISETARRHGNNITVVLDCCHSGDGTRNTIPRRGVRRYVEPGSLAPLYPGIDQGLVGHTLPVPPSRTRARFSSPAANHVLMAACGPRESAVGEAFKGGYFTTLWLAALRDETICPRTYAELLESIEEQMLQQNYRPRLTDQHPQCDGVVRHRLVFQETVIGKTSFAVKTSYAMGDNPRFYIAAGEIHGVDNGAVFYIYEKHQHPPGIAALAEATVECVHSTVSLISFKNRGYDAPSLDPLNQSQYLAVAAEQTKTVKYMISQNQSDSFEKSAEAMDLFGAQLLGIAGAVKAISEVQREEGPDLELCFGDIGDVTLHPLSLDAKLRVPSVLSPATALGLTSGEIIQTLQQIARFNRLLSLQPSKPSFGKDIRLELYALPNVDPRAHSQSFASYQNGSSVRICEGQAEVLQDRPHALVLHNNSKEALYVQIWYFCPATYEITLCYKAPNPFEANLSPKSELQIGASKQRSDPLFFHRPEGKDASDTTFMKIFVADSPVDLDSYEQGDIFEVSELRHAANRAPGLSPKAKPLWSAAETLGKEGAAKWETLLLRINV